MNVVPDRLRGTVAAAASDVDLAGVLDSTTDRKRIGALSVVLVAAGFVLALGPLGAVAGAVVVGCRYAYSTEAAFALGCLFLAVAGDPSLGTALVGLSLLGTLVGPVLALENSLRTLLAFLLALASSLLLAWLALVWGESVWAGAFGLVVWIGFCAYALHRYSLLVAGVLGSRTPDGAEAADDPESADDPTRSIDTTEATGGGTVQ